MPVMPDRFTSEEWKKRTGSVCKPCWELKYCPYGPLVEDFPFPPIPRKEAIEHNEFLEKQIAAGAYDEERLKIFQQEVDEFNPDNYPESPDPILEEQSCRVFGHICPVFLVNEPLSETSEPRKMGRNISRDVIIRVARRDNYTCQICKRHLLENEIEFDHIIPVAKGGSSEENNIRVTCIECNRKKGKKINL